MRYPNIIDVATQGLSLAGLIVALTISGFAAPPANDTCQGALVVPGNGPFPYLTPVITNINAATLTGDPSASSAGCGTIVTTSGGIWFVFTPQNSGTYHISVSDDTETTVLDTFMAVYQTATCSGSFSAPIACNDDQGDLMSAVSVSLTAGSTYYMVVWAAWTTPGPSTSTVQLRVSRPTVPANDTCAGAEVIPGSGPFPYLTQIADTTLATITGDPPQLPPSCTTNTFAATVWYRFTPSASRTYAVSTCEDTRTSVYDTLLGIYTGNCGGPYTLVACSDFYNRRAIITNAFTAGTTYYIVAGDATQEGVIPGETLIQLRIFEPRGPESRFASSITPTSAVINATVPNCNVAPIQAWFEWGPTATYGNATPVQLFKTGTTDVMLSTLLSPISTAPYHYRLVMINCFGMAESADQVFAWSPTRPTLVPSKTPTGFRFQFNANPGQIYTIFSSPVLPSFQLLGPATEIAPGTFEFRDTNSPSTARRFFEIRSP
jgi:hypothetical protein